MLSETRFAGQPGANLTTHMSTFRGLRRSALVLAGLSSILAGVVLVWFVFRPGVLSSTPTLHLLALLGMLILPGLSIAGWAMDRRESRRAAAPSTTAASHLPRAVTHVAGQHGRAPGRHASRDEARHAELRRAPRGEVSTARASSNAERRQDLAEAEG